MGNNTYSIDPLFYTTFQIMRVIYNYTCILISPRKNFKFVGRAIKNPLCIFFIKSLYLSLRYVCGCFWNKIVSNKKKLNKKRYCEIETKTKQNNKGNNYNGTTCRTSALFITRYPLIFLLW